MEEAERALAEAARLRLPDVRRALLIKHAEHLSESMRAEDAAVARLAAGDLTGALDEYRAGASWQQALALAGRVESAASGPVVGVLLLHGRRQPCHATMHVLHVAHGERHPPVCGERLMPRAAPSRVTGTGTGRDSRPARQSAAGGGGRLARRRGGATALISSIRGARVRTVEAMRRRLRSLAAHAGTHDFPRCSS